MKMSFKKTGDVIQIEKVYCPCGGEIEQDTQKCQKCQKDFDMDKDAEKDTSENPQI
jgi:hypothetical protein